MNNKQLVKIYKSLANEKRLEIFLNILKSENISYKAECNCLISDVIQDIGIGAPTISHHLKELSNAGLIETKKDGKYLIAHVNKDLINELREVFDIK